MIFLGLAVLDPESAPTTQRRRPRKYSWGATVSKGLSSPAAGQLHQPANPAGEEPVGHHTPQRDESARILADQRAKARRGLGDQARDGLAHRVGGRRLLGLAEE